MIVDFGHRYSLTSASLCCWQSYYKLEVNGEQTVIRHYSGKSEIIIPSDIVVSRDSNISTDVETDITWQVRNGSAGFDSLSVCGVAFPHPCGTMADSVFVPRMSLWFRHKSTNGGDVKSLQILTFGWEYGICLKKPPKLTLHSALRGIDRNRKILDIAFDTDRAGVNFKVVLMPEMNGYRVETIVNGVHEVLGGISKSDGESNVYLTATNMSSLSQICCYIK